MSLEKIKMKRDVYKEVGKELDQAIGLAKVDTLRLQGAKIVLTTNLPNILTKIVDAWNKDFEDEKIGKSAHETVTKLYTQIVKELKELSAKVEEDSSMLMSKIKAMEVVLNSMNAKFDEEGKKAESILAAKEEQVSGREIGEHPGPSLATERKVKSVLKLASDKKDDPESTDSN